MFSFFQTNYVKSDKVFSRHTGHYPMGHQSVLVEQIEKAPFQSTHGRSPVTQKKHRWTELVFLSLPGSVFLKFKQSQGSAIAAGPRAISGDANRPLESKTSTLSFGARVRPTSGPQEPTLLFVSTSRPQIHSRPVEDASAMLRLKFQPSARDAELTSAGRSAPLVWLRSLTKGVFWVLRSFDDFQAVAADAAGQRTSSRNRGRIWFGFVSWLQGEMLSQFCCSLLLLWRKVQLMQLSLWILCG